MLWENGEISINKSLVFNLKDGNINLLSRHCYTFLHKQLGGPHPHPAIFWSSLHSRLISHWKSFGKMKLNIPHSDFSTYETSIYNLPDILFCIFFWGGRIGNSNKLITEHHCWMSTATISTFYIHPASWSQE